MMMMSMMSSAPAVTHRPVAALLAEAESKYMAHQNALADAEEVKSTDTVKYAELIKAAEAIEDMAVLAIEQYIPGKNTLKAEEMPGGYVVLVDNVLHSMWSGVDTSMNQENVSTMNGKYMYKAYVKSASTKTYQLETLGFYGDSGDKDEDFHMTYNDGMNRRYLRFCNCQKVQLQGFLHSDIMGILGSIVNSVEINITLIPNQDSIRLQTLAREKYVRLFIDDVVLCVCKHQMSREVVMAHRKVMENTPASYPFMRIEVKTYNVHTGETEVIIENPYLSDL